jgi:uncharacterized surface protein with fasciclin (FAS1) repeats
MKNINALLKKYLTACLMLLMGSCSDNFKEAPSSTKGATIVDIASANPDFTILSATLVKTNLVYNFNNTNAGSFTVFAPTDQAFINFFNALPSTIVLAPGSPAPPFDKAGIISLIKGLAAAYPTPLNPSLPLGSSYLTTGGLSGILTYHVLSSSVGSSQVTSAQSFVTQNGSRLSLTKVGDIVVLNADRSVTIGGSINAPGNGAKTISASTTNITASNGLIHAIDRVLTPLNIANIWAGGATAPAPPTSLPNFSVDYSTTPPSIRVGVGATVLPLTRNSDGSINLINTAANNSAPVNTTDTDFNLLQMALARANLVTTIIPNVSPLPDFTLFAPNDLAFRTYLGLPGIALTELAARAKINDMLPSGLANILLYHVVVGRVTSSDLSDGQVLNTALSGKSFSISVSGNTATLVDVNTANTNPTFNISKSTVSASLLTNAGVFYQINNVLLPN